MVYEVLMMKMEVSNCIYFYYIIIYYNKMSAFSNIICDTGHTFKTFLIFALLFKTVTLI